MNPLYTQIVDSKLVKGLLIVREDSNNYPIEKSNIYALNSDNEIVWFAELPSLGEIYINPIVWDSSINPNATDWNDYYLKNENSFVVSSAQETVCIDYITGKILSKEFTM